MRAGTLRRRIVIETPTETQDTFGEPDVTWSEFASIRASVEPLAGREFFQSRQFDAEISTRFIMRYVSGITAKMRVKYDSRYFDINAVINVDDRNRETVLMCTENV